MGANKTKSIFCDLLTTPGRTNRPAGSHSEKEIDVNSSHMSALQTKHADLEALIDREERRPSPDETLLHDLKKRKLTIKDEISGLRH